MTGKFDFEATSKDHFSLTLGRSADTELNPGPGGIPGFDSTTQLSSRFLNLAYIRTISPNLLNEFRATAQTNYTLQATPAVQDPTGAALGIKINSENPTGPARIDFPAQGLLVGFSIQGPSTLVDNTFAYTDTLSWTRGKHTLKFGGSFSAYQDNQVFNFEINGGLDFFGNLTDANNKPFGAGDAFANFLVGLPGDFFQGPAAPSSTFARRRRMFLDRMSGM